MSSDHKQLKVRLRDLSPRKREFYFLGLDSENEALCRRCVQRLVDLEDAPVGYISCWPEMNCTELQFVTTLAVLREWTEWGDLTSEGGTYKVVDLRTEPDFMPLRRLRAEAGEKRATPAPPAPSLLEKALDHLNDVVKDTILDRPYGDEESEFSDPNEDIPLGTLNRQAFFDAMHAKFAATLNYIADTVARPATDFDLAKCEEEVGRFLHELRWDTLQLAFELRSGEAATESDTRVRSTPPAPTEQSWAERYRRMKALGH